MSTLLFGDENVYSRIEKGLHGDHTTSNLSICLFFAVSRMDDKKSNSENLFSGRYFTTSVQSHSARVLEVE